MIDKNSFFRSFLSYFELSMDYAEEYLLKGTSGMTRPVKIFDIEDRLTARGFRMARDKMLHVVREGVMTLPGSIILSLIDLLESYDLAISQVPPDWLMSHAELAEAGII